MSHTRVLHTYMFLQVGWFTRKLAEKYSVILLRHVTNDKVIRFSLQTFVLISKKSSGHECHN